MCGSQSAATDATIYQRCLGRNVLIFEIGSSLSELQTFINVFGCRFPGLYDQGNIVYQNYRVPHPEAPYPQDYIIDQEGNVAYWSDEYDPCEIIRVIDRLIGGTGVEVHLTPHNPPVQIPPTGGSFFYSVEIVNNDSSAFTLDGWINAILPNGGTYGPLVLRRGLNIPPGAVLVRELTQYVPAYAPAGNYTYCGNAGFYPDSVIASDDFPFLKLPGDNLPGACDSWELRGWDDDDYEIKPDLPYREGITLNASPNPFNAEVYLEYALPYDMVVELGMFDVKGRKVTELAGGFYPQGRHRVKWNADGIPSGIYFYRLKGESFTVTGKCLLLR